MSIPDALRLLLKRWQLQEIDIEHEYSRFQELFGAAEMDAALFGLLEEEDPVIQVLAMDLLGRGQAKESAFRISEVLADPDPDLRAAAVLALWRRHALEYLAQVLPLLADPDWNVRAQVVDFIRTADPEQVEDQVLAFLENPHPGVRASAADLCADTSKVERLAPLLKDPSPEVRVAAVRGLGRHGRRFLELISALKKDPSPDVREAADEVLKDHA